MSKTFTPITILLIEDNPAQEGFKAKDLKSRGINIGLLDDNIDVPGICFIKEDSKELHSLFVLKVLQHPEEIKEYIANCLEKEDKEGSVALGKIEGIIPEIVEFDYKLSDNFQINSENKNIKYWSSFKQLREYYNPNFLFGGVLHLEKKENQNYTVKDFIERLNPQKNGVTGNEDWYKKDVADLTNRDDELGLYAGVEITRLFRDHVCIGIPATFNFNLRERLHAFGKFYEWINEYDLGTMFSREERGSKDWDSVISAAVKQLRTRIEIQLLSNKILLNLSQLLEYAETIPTKQEDRIFTFQSAYGERHLPLDGLFIDVEKNEREASIKKWISTLLNNFKTEAYKTSKDASTKLVEAYQAIPVIKNRIRLSELAVKLCNSETLDCTEKNEIEKLKAEFGINDTQIDNCIKNGPAENSNLINKVIEYREVKTNDNETNRLIVLFTDLQVHRVWQNFCEINKNAVLDVQISTLLKSRPTLDDLRAALFPIPKNPLVLPYHYHLLSDKSKFKSKDAFEVWDTHLGKNKLNNNALFPKTEYPKGLNIGEKQLCKSFALDIGLDNNYYPNWLIK